MTFSTIAFGLGDIKAFVMSPIFMFVVIIAIMYFMMIRPQRKRQKEIENFRKGLQPGQDVVTSGGIYGKIKEVDNGIVVLEVSKGVDIRVDVSVVFASTSAMQQK